MLIRLRESYVLDQGPVTLDVTIGEGQRGYLEVLLAGALVADGKGVKNLQLGNGPDLAGKKLRVTATVTDTNPNTNHTSVTYTLRGGKENQTFVSDHEVDSAGDTVDYDAIFVLI